MTSRIAILILAAGKSSRLGQPKQLLIYHHQPLIRHVTVQCIESEVGDVFALVGHEAEKVKEVIADLDVSVLSSKNWHQGMSSTLAEGISFVKNRYDGVIIVLCDQIHISSDVIRKLHNEAMISGKSIVISDYGVAKGPPSFFDKSLFSELSLLSGDEGAKQIVQKNIANVQTIPFENGLIDIDLPEHINLLQ